MIGFLIKQLKAKHACYLKAALKLKMNKTLNLFLVKRIVIIPTVCYSFLIQFNLSDQFQNINFSAKLLVTTGSYMNSHENGFHSEVIDIDYEDIECNELANSAHSIQGAAGGLVSGKPMICGGFYANPLTEASKKCFVLGENQSITMEHERSYPASISISKDKVSHYILEKNNVTGIPWLAQSPLTNSSLL